MPEIWSSLGVLSTCGVLLFREADPVTWILSGLMKLLGGVFFPVALLPEALQGLSRLLPLTYGLEGLRRAVLTGTPLTELGGVCLTLGAFSLVLWPLAVVTLCSTLNRLKTAGTLSFR